MDLQPPNKKRTRRGAPGEVGTTPGSSGLVVTGTLYKGAEDDAKMSKNLGLYLLP